MASPSMTMGSIASAISRRTEAIVVSDRPSPGPTTSAPNREMSSSTCGAQSTASIGGWITSSRHVITPPGTDMATSPAPLRTAADEHRRAAPRIDALPATTRTAPFHLCAARGSPRPPRRDVARLARGGPSNATCRDRCRRRRRHRTVPGRDPINIPGLIAWKVTVRSAVKHPTADTCRRRHRGRSGCRPPAPGARPTSGRLHPDPARRPVPNAASITRSAGGQRAVGTMPTSNTRTRTPAGREPLRGDTTVGTVVARADDDVDDAAVRSAEHPQRGATDGPPGPIDQHLGRFRRGARRWRASPRR